MAELKNPIAECDRPDSGIVTTPEQAYKVKDNHKFFCPDFDCGDPGRVLTLARSVNGIHFFRHKPGFDHDIRPETLLHKLAVRWFERKNEFEVPEYKASTYTLPPQTVQLDPNLTVCEYRRLKVLIPDVKCCCVNGFEFAIEIVVTSDVDLKKQKLIKEFGIPVVRIDLSRFYKKHPEKCRVDVEFINQNLGTLLTEPNLKRWVVEPSLESIDGKLKWTPVDAVPAKISVQSNSQSTDSGQGCLLAVLFLGFLYLIWPKAKPNNKSKKRGG